MVVEDIEQRRADDQREQGRAQSDHQHHDDCIHDVTLLGMFS